MDTTPAVRGLACRDCQRTFDAGDATHRCPECGGPLAVEYDLDAVGDDLRDALRGTVETDTGGRDAPGGRGDGIGRYADLLPLGREDLVSLGEGGTPLVDCPRLADELGVGAVYVKDEGHNPTGSVADRGLAVAVSVAAAHGADTVALPTPGSEGQAAAAYAARAGLDSQSFVPSRATFDNKAMINVHGGEMSVVGGRYDDAVAAFAEAMDDQPWYSLAPFGTPYRQEGQKTLAYELVEQLGSAPDAVVCPTGEGVGLVGAYRGTRDLIELGLVDGMPALYAAQAAGCAPIVEAYKAGADSPDPWKTPDTICGGIEIPDPAGGEQVLAALRETDGGAVAAEDSDTLESAVTVAQSEGVELGASAGVAASGAWELAQDGAFDDDDTVVLVNTLTGNAEADVLRSHLMSKGV